MFALVMLPLAVWRAPTHRVAAQRRIMILLFTGGVVVARLFTRLPGASCTGDFRPLPGGFARLVQTPFATVAVRA